MAVTDPPGVQDVHWRQSACLQQPQRGVLTGRNADSSATRLHDLHGTGCQSELLPQPLGHRSERFLEILLAHQPDDVIEDHCLTFALLRLATPLALVGRQLAGDDRCHQEEEERDPLLGIRNRPLM
jgi:hypothetical protein